MAAANRKVTLQYSTRNPQNDTSFTCAFEMALKGTRIGSDRQCEKGIQPLVEGGRESFYFQTALLLYGCHFNVITLTDTYWAQASPLP